jgi:hypothetical protein
VYDVFRFSPSNFDFFVPLALLSKKILVFNFTLQIKFIVFFSNSNNIYFSLVLFRLISYLFYLPFCQSSYDFLFYHSKLVYDFDNNNNNNNNNNNSNNSNCSGCNSSSSSNNNNDNNTINSDYNVNVNDNNNSLL